MKLKTIASNMTKFARQTGLAKHSLERGLHLTLQHGADRWTISLTRYATHASDTERRICCEAFGVPAGTDHEAEYVNGYGVTRYVWGEEYEQLGLGLVTEQSAQVRYE